MRFVDWAYFTFVTAFAAFIVISIWRGFRAERKRLNAQVEAEIRDGLAKLDRYLEEMSRP